MSFQPNEVSGEIWSNSFLDAASVYDKPQKILQRICHLKILNSPFYILNSLFCALPDHFTNSLIL